MSLTSSRGAASTTLSAAPQSQSDHPKGQGLVQVESKYVCMINNQRFNKEQMPVADGFERIALLYNLDSGRHYFLQFLPCLTRPGLLFSLVALHAPAGALLLDHMRQFMSQ